MTITTITAWLIAALFCGSLQIHPTPATEAVDDIDLKALFDQGIAYDAFLNDVVRRRQMWVKNDARAKVSDEVLDRARAVRGAWRLLAVAEDWCSDSANVLPYLAELVDAVDNLELRIIGSEAGKELMERHKTPDGRASTPTIVLLDADYKTQGCFIERPQELQTWALENKEELGEKEFIKQKLAWYNRDQGQQSIEEVVRLMEAAASGSGGC